MCESTPGRPGNGIGKRRKGRENDDRHQNHLGDFSDVGRDEKGAAIDEKL